MLRRSAGLLRLLLALPLAACSDKASSSPSPAGAASESSPASAATVPAGSPAASSTRPALPASGSTAVAAAVGSAQFEPDRAMAHVEKLAGEIGPRVAGSPGESRAVDHIAAELRAGGFDVEVMPFNFTDDPYRPATVSTSAGGRDANTMAGSPGGDVSAPAVFVGLADDAGIGSKVLQGKVAVADRGVLDFKTKYQNVRAAGAVALVIIGNDDQVFTGALNTKGDIPVVSTTHADGEPIRKAAMGGEQVTVEAPDPGSTQSLNVLARPSKDARCTVLVGGHHDTVPKAPGAHDNASGTATVLELARAFAADGIDAGLCFATFGAEESGLHGSAAMAAAMKANGTLPSYFLNLDATGIGSRVDIYGSSDLQASAAALAEKLGIPAKISQLGLAFGSDHQSFQKVGVPVVYFASDSLGHFHTPLDVPADIQPEELGRIGALSQAYILELLAKVARGSGRS